MKVRLWLVGRGDLGLADHSREMIRDFDGNDKVETFRQFGTPAGLRRVPVRDVSLYDHYIVLDGKEWFIANRMIGEKLVELTEP